MSNEKKNRNIFFCHVKCMDNLKNKQIVTDQHYSYKQNLLSSVPTLFSPIPFSYEIKRNSL